MYLHERIDVLKQSGQVPTIPSCIKDNLTKKFSLRPYQEEAFTNYLTYFESQYLRQYGNQVLFHMATGSGKTLIIAGLILYLYKQGYRNFLFFVSARNIVSKTRDNLMDSRSSKYLYNDEIVIDDRRVKLKEVNSFANSDPDSINICFTTIQKIREDFVDIRENGITFEDFADNKVVFISDESHHLTAEIKKKSKSLTEETVSWEYVAKRLYRANPDNILLEFTATCRLDIPEIFAEYESKVVYDYSLKQFRVDGYSKEIKTLQTDLSFHKMALQALVLSQYRLKLFNDINQDIKPVILFKSKTVAEFKAFYSEFGDNLSKLSGADLADLDSGSSGIVKIAFDYFRSHDISYDLLAQELKEAFGPSHCIDVYEKSDAAKKGIAVNSLEDKSNPYRAVFVVDMLNEGWDVLNLFDIVRLYDTRDAKNGKPGTVTTAEAQLIGRGARYCPFIYEGLYDKYVRKFDSDLGNPLRACEELYYHCHTNSRYIDELHTALVETGIVDDTVVTRHLKLKDDFKNTRLYKEGVVFINNQEESSRKGINSLPSSIRDRNYHYSLSGSGMRADSIMDHVSAPSSVRQSIDMTIGEIAALNYNSVHSAIRKYPKLNFDNLKQLFPDLKSMNDFIFNKDYLGNLTITIECDDDPSISDLNTVCIYVLGLVAESLESVSLTYSGSEAFHPVLFNKIFRDKIVHYTDPNGEGVGIPQIESGTWKLDLSLQDWYAFNENYGTGEEKGLVYNFAKWEPVLSEKYDEVYLIRNERHMCIYSFDEGRRFEPDFLLFLGRKGSDSFEQMQIFIEPKGENLMHQDRWKQDFLLQIKDRYKLELVPMLDDTDYTIWGLPFYNNSTVSQFKTEFDKII